MTEIANPLHAERWRQQALKIAAELKQVPNWNGKDKIKAGIAFDDQIVSVTLETALIERLNESALADLIYNGVLELQKSDHRAAGESADPEATVPGMESGHAASQARTMDTNGSPAPEPAAAAVSEKCSRKVEPDFTEACPSAATGGLRVILHAAPALQKRWGRRSLMTFIMDLPVCPSCFQKLNVMEVTDEQLRKTLGRTAQQMNSGILVDWSQTQVEHLPFEAPEYVALRRSMEKHRAANDGSAA